MRLRLGRRHVDRAGDHPRAAQLDHQPCREALRLQGEAGMQLLLEPVAGLGAQAELLRGHQDVGAVPGRRLHRDPGGVRADLAAGAAHDPADPGGPLRVTHQHGVAVEDALLAVQRREALALARGAHVQLRPGHAVEVVGVHRLPEQQHHVVRDVDDVADRALSDRHQARLQPQRRGADLHVLEHAHAEPRAERRDPRP